MPELLTIKQAADFLQVTPHCIYRGIKAGRIPYLKISKRLIRIPATALAANQAPQEEEDMEVQRRHPREFRELGKRLDQFFGPKLLGAGRTLGLGSLECAWHWTIDHGPEPGRFPEGDIVELFCKATLANPADPQGYLQCFIDTGWLFKTEAGWSLKDPCPHDGPYR